MVDAIMSHKWKINLVKETFKGSSPKGKRDSSECGVTKPKEKFYKGRTG